MDPGHYLVISAREAKRLKLKPGDKIVCPYCRERTVSKPWNFGTAMEVLGAHLQSVTGVPQY